MSCENNCENTIFYLEQENQPELPVEKREEIDSGMETKQGQNSEIYFTSDSAMSCQQLKDDNSIRLEEGEKMMESITNKGPEDVEPPINELNNGCVENNEEKVVLKLNCTEAATKENLSNGVAVVNDKGEAAAKIAESDDKPTVTTSTPVNNKQESTNVNEADIIKNIKIRINNHPLRTVSLYDSDSSSSSDIPQSWRDNIIDCSEGTSSGTEEEEGEMNLVGIPRLPDVVENPRLPNNNTTTTTNNKGAIKKNPPVNNDLEFDDLPPVPDLSTLNINADTEKFVHMGHIMGIIGRIVTVEAIPNGPAYDLDTVLFLDNGKRPLGIIFDVLGQVSAPMYAIRFNSADDIKQMQISIGMKVYSAPNSQHTQYVFMQQLLKMKGSDASWEEDIEVPPEFADFSDDEAEVNARKCNLHKKRSLKKQEEQDGHHKRFEAEMNKRNIINTKLNKYMDSYLLPKTIIKSHRQFRVHHHHHHHSPQQQQQQQQKPKQQQQQQQQQRQLWQQQQQPHSQSQQLPPDFNPTIPPPNLVPLQHAHFLTNPPSTFLPPEFLASLENNNSNNMQFEPVLGGFVNVNQYFLNNTARNTNSSDNYLTNNAGKDHPGPSHE